MKTISHLIAFLALVSGMARADFIVVPPDRATKSGNAATGPGFGTPDSYQNVYGAKNFSGPVTITGIAFRLGEGGGELSFSVDIPRLTIQLANAAPQGCARLPSAPLSPRPARADLRNQNAPPNQPATWDQPPPQKQPADDRAKRNLKTPNAIKHLVVAGQAIQATREKQKRSPFAKAFWIPPGFGVRALCAAFNRL